MELNDMLMKNLATPCAMMIFATRNPEINGGDRIES